MLREALIYSHIAATAAWRDEMQGVARSQGSFSLTRDATRQFARQTPSHMGCGQIGCSLSCTAWHRSPSYDLRRTRRDLPDLTRNAAHGGINQRFPSMTAMCQLRSFTYTAAMIYWNKTKKEILS